MAAPVLQFKRGLLANLPGLRAGEPGFTTDSYDLYVGIDSTTTNNKFFGSHRYWTRGTATTGSGVNLVEATNNGTQYLTLKSPDSLAGITTYTLPASPIDSYFLKTNSLGILEWSNQFPSIGVTQFTAGIATFTDQTDNTLGNADTGAVQIDGGLGVNKNVTVGGNLNVQGYSEFVGVVTFRGGTINIGDGTSDNISVGGRFSTNLVPNQDNAYDVGISTLNWRNAHFSGIGTFETGAVIDGVQIGINGANVIDTVSGNLTLNSAGGTTIIDDYVTIQNNLNVNGNVTIGGTFVSIVAQDVYVKDKDIVLGYTTSITGADASTDNSANHGGIAIASTEGTPLVPFTAAGVNTLPDTYKQMMWFKSGTLGFSTDAFAFNYGVAVGTTSMANGLRFKVGSGITMTDTVVSATTFVGAFTGNASSADQVKTVTAGNDSANYYVTFVNSLNGSATNETVYTDDGIYYNPGTNTFTTQYGYFTGNVTVDGSLTGTASTATRATLVDTTATSTNADYYVTFVDTLAGQNSETIRVGAALSVNPSDGSVKTTGVLSVGNPGDLTSYIKAGGGSNAMYLYGNGDVSFQAKVITNSIRSSSDSNDAITLSVRDASFGNNIYVSGIGTVVGDLTVNGGDLITSASVFNLINTNATNVNFAGAATDLVIGATTGITTIRNNLFVGGDIKVGGNDIQASDGATNISLTSNTLTAFAGDIKVGGNDIQASDGATNITLTSSTLTAFAGDIKVGGNDIQASDGTTALTLAASSGDVTVAGDLRINGNDIKASDGATNITLTSNTLASFAGDIKLGGNDIQASDGTTNITLTSNTLTTFAGDIKVTGNDIQASDGQPNITMTSNTLTEIKGDLQVTGNDIKSSTGAAAISLSGSDVTVNGNLYISGNTTQVNTTALTVEDRTIDLGIVNGAAPSADTTWDLGVLFNYYSSGAAKKSAVVWEHADGRFKFAKVLDADADGTNNNTPQLGISAGNFAPIEIAELWVNNTCVSDTATRIIGCTGSSLLLENITIDGGSF